MLKERNPWDDPEYDGLARYWKTLWREEKSEENQKGKIVGGKKIWDILCINPYKMERMLKRKYTTT